MQCRRKCPHKIVIGLLFFLLPGIIHAGFLHGYTLDMSKNPIKNAQITLEKTGEKVFSNELGEFKFENIPNGTYLLNIEHKDFSSTIQSVKISDKTPDFIIYLIEKVMTVGPVEIKENRPIGRGKDISEDEVSLGKQKLVIKTEGEKKVTSSLTRSIDAPVNIIEYDGAGLQLGIGGRGLNPKRTAHYNTRQNGYEISADALGYPETYYTPPIEAIEQIDLLRGAASLQYGPQFGGMINFKLKDGPSSDHKKIEVISNNRIGSFNQYHSFNSIATKSKKIKTYSFYNYKIGDGWRNNSSYDSHTGFTSITYQPTKKLSVKLQLTKYFYIVQQAGGLTDNQFYENPQQSNRERNWFNIDWNIAALIAHYKINSNSWINSKTFYVNASRNSVGYMENPQREDPVAPVAPRVIIAGNFENIGNETRWIKRYKIKNKDNAIISGIRLYKGWAQTSQAAGSKGSDPNFSLPNKPEYSQYKFPSANIAGFIENTFFLTKKIYLTPGYRYEHIITKTDGYFNQYTINNANDTIQANTIPSDFEKERDIHLIGTGITFNQGKKGKWIANISKNFRSVNFSDINIVVKSLKVDSNIQDERGYTADLTFTKNWSRKAFLSITGYLLHYANRIGLIWETDETTWDVYQYRTNISKSRTLGLELTNWLDLGKTLFSLDKIHKLNLLTNITTNYAKYTQKGTVVYGNWIEMVPALTLKSSLTYEYKKWLFSGLINFQSRQFSEATNGIESFTGVDGVIPSFYVVDLKTGYQLKKNITLQVSVNNVTNKMYFTQRANSYPGPGIIPSEGRVYWGTMIFKF